MKICMLLHKSVEHDSRVRREATALAEAGHDVTVIHLANEEGELDGWTRVSALPPRRLRRLPFAAHRLVMMWTFIRAVRRARPDVVHAHDCAMLAPGFVASRLARARLVYDSHEYAAGVAWRTRPWAALVSGIERVAAPRCDAVITVSDGIADRLQERYRLQGRPVVLRNIPDTQAPGTETESVRERLGIGDKPLILHQGALAPRRGCETLVKALAGVPDAHLLFLGDAWPGYMATIQSAVRREGVERRAHFIPSVPVDLLLSHTRQADVGVSLLSDDCENHRLALPNKVFEYIAAGVPVVTSDLPELRRLVEEHDVGWTVDASDPERLAHTLSIALGERGRRTEAVQRLARKMNWATERRRLLDTYAAFDAGKLNRPRALVFVRNAVTYDARVLREGQLLQELGYDTTIIGSVSTAVRERNAELGGVPVVRLAPGAFENGLRSRGLKHQRRAAIARSSHVSSRPPKLGGQGSLRRLALALDWYRLGVSVLRRSRPVLVHCNDYNTMWIGVAAKLRGARVIYDSHELWPDRNLRPEARWWLMLCEAAFVRIADQVVTTSPGYAAAMAKRYRVPVPTVVRNIPSAPPGRPHSQRAVRGVATYFGAVTRHRGLEAAIAALAHLSDVRLRIVGPDAWGYRAVLRQKTLEAGLEHRVELADPVRPERTFDELGKADVGLALIEPVCLSYQLTLPNKLFEYVHAGLPILASNTPVLGEFVERNALGLAIDPADEDAVADGLARLLSPPLNEQCRLAAERLANAMSWENESQVLAAAYARKTMTANPLRREGSAG